MIFNGFIRDVRYTPHAQMHPLRTVTLEGLQARALAGACLLSYRDIVVGYSQWVSPKRTRSYPFARLYRTYHQPKRVTVIPIMKDEGVGGDCDRMNAMTFSWMNLANVFIILAYYDHALPHPRSPDKLTNQTLNTEYLRSKLAEVLTYQQTALHWNTTHFENDFVRVFEVATQRYQSISQQYGVEVHSAQSHEKTLQSYFVGGQFSIDTFKQSSLPRSYRSSQSELQTTHLLESLSDGQKAYFHLHNYLGGEYHLTADEVFFDGDILIIQESKNAPNKKLPSINDIQDGLFKLMLFANISELKMANRTIPFQVRLKLMGQLQGALALPCDTPERKEFCHANVLTPWQTQMIERLQREAHDNRLIIKIMGNTS